MLFHIVYSGTPVPMIFVAIVLFIKNASGWFVLSVERLKRYVTIKFNIKRKQVRYEIILERLYENWTKKVGNYD